MPTILSRFDMIFIVKDRHDVAKDEVYYTVAEHEIRVKYLSDTCQHKVKFILVVIKTNLTVALRNFRTDILKRPEQSKS